MNVAYNMINKELLLALLFFCSCKTAERQKTAQQSSAPPATPMTCRIKGVIIGISKINEKDTGNICSKYPCRARVRILDVYGCGSSIAVPLNTGEDMEMKFAYTLHSTEIFAGMKTRFPGLHEGDHFVANAEQRMIMGGNGEFVVYDYELIK